jgi:hypothetical protein
MLKTCSERSTLGCNAVRCTPCCKLVQVTKNADGTFTLVYNKCAGSWWSSCAFKQVPTVTFKVRLFSQSQPSLFCPIRSICMTEQVDTTNGLKLTQTGGNVVCGNGADKTCLDVCALPACRSTPVHTQRPHAHTRVLSQSLPHSNAHFLPPSLTHSHSHRWYSRARLCLPLRKSATPASSTKILPAPMQYARTRTPASLSRPLATTGARAAALSSSPSRQHFSGRRYPVRVHHGHLTCWNVFCHYNFVYVLCYVATWCTVQAVISSFAQSFFDEAVCHKYA